MVAPFRASRFPFLSLLLRFRLVVDSLRNQVSKRNLVSAQFVRFQKAKLLFQSSMNLIGKRKTTLLVNSKLPNQTVQGSVDKGALANNLPFREIQVNIKPSSRRAA